MSIKENNLLSKKIYINDNFSCDDDFYIENRDCGIKEILDATATIVLSSYKIIDTSDGKKLLLTGYKMLNLLYTCNKQCNEVLNERFSKRFINLLDIHSTCWIKDIAVKILYADVIIQSPRHIIASIMYDVDVNACIIYYVPDEDCSWHKDMGCDSYSIVGSKKTSHKFNMGCNMRDSYKK